MESEWSRCVNPSDTTACPYIIHEHWFKDTLDFKQVAH